MATPQLQNYWMDEMFTYPLSLNWNYLVLNNCIIVDLNQAIKSITIELKQKYKLKLPDAIIAATSIYMNLPLISADKDFDRISPLQFIRYEI